MSISSVEQLLGMGGTPNLPKTLPEAQRKLVDYAAPGLRQILGYA